MGYIISFAAGLIAGIILTAKWVVWDREQEIEHQTKMRARMREVRLRGTTISDLCPGCGKSDCAEKSETKSVSHEGTRRST